jgi:hypothetical protein
MVRLRVPFHVPLGNRVGLCSSLVELIVRSLLLGGLACAFPGDGFTENQSESARSGRVS